MEKKAKNRSLGKKISGAMTALVLGMLLIAISIFGFMMLKTIRTLSSSNDDLRETIRDKSSAYMTEQSQARMLELAGEKAKTAELEGVNGASATIDRGQGFHSVADEKLDVVASQTANFNRAEGMTVMENMLQANPDIKCVFAHNDEMALGAIEAIGDKEIIVAGFDATDDAVEAVKEGKMAATVAQQPELMGATAVETAGKLIAGESVEKTLPVEVSLVTKDNAK